MEKAGPPEPSKIFRALTPTLDATAPPGAPQSPYVPPAATEGEVVPPFGMRRALKRVVFTMAWMTSVLLAFMWMSPNRINWSSVFLVAALGPVLGLLDALWEWWRWPDRWRAGLAKEEEKKNRKRKRTQT
jgi:hypothetical protein